MDSLDYLEGQEVHLCNVWSAISNKHTKINICFLPGLAKYLAELMQFFLSQYTELLGTELPCKKLFGSLVITDITITNCISYIFYYWKLCSFTSLMEKLGIMDMISRIGKYVSVTRWKLGDLCAGPSSPSSGTTCSSSSAQFWKGTRRRRRRRKKTTAGYSSWPGRRKRRRRRSATAAGSSSWQG
jgi:hypothetical protein